VIWSFSHSRSFKRCQRHWYFKTYVANANAKKDPLRREAYLLSKLQTISAWRGQIVDDVIARTIIPALNGKYEPTLAAILTIAKRTFEAQLAFGRRHGVRDPGFSRAKAGDAFAAFYAVEYGGTVSEEEIERAWAEIKEALANLFEMHKLLATLKSSTYIIAQRTLTFAHLGITVRAVPDVIAFYEKHPPFIVDWKVHTSGMQEYRLQLALYALALTRCTPHRDFPEFVAWLDPTEIRLAEAQLLTKNLRAYALSKGDIDEVEAYIAESATQMLLATGSEPHGQLRPVDFPATDFPEVCEQCPYRSLCWEKVDDGP
jgi:PD-(D/E)XK nuclease superfamily